jgi:hypothetical protein
MAAAAARDFFSFRKYSMSCGGGITYKLEEPQGFLLTAAKRSPGGIWGITNFCFFFPLFANVNERYIYLICYCYIAFGNSERQLTLS